MKKLTVIIAILTITFSSCRTYEEGKIEGYDEGYDEGHYEGHYEGFEEGKIAGYDEGYDDCQNGW